MTALRASVLGGLLLLVTPSLAHAANHYVRAAASGTASGNDWTNAYTDLPAALTRGDTYYVAAGTYGIHTFGDTASGTTVITIKSPTVTDHGTGTGWSDSFVGQATFVGPASPVAVGFAIFYFTTGYYTIDGVSLPKRVAVEVPQSMLKLQLDVDRWSINQPLPEGAATFELPRTQLSSHAFVDMADPSFIPPGGNQATQPTTPRPPAQARAEQPRRRGFSWH